MTIINALADFFGYLVCSGCRKFTRIDRQVCCYRGSSHLDEINLDFCPRCYPRFVEMIESEKRQARYRERTMAHAQEVHRE